MLTRALKIICKTYENQFGKAPPRYFKFICIAFGGICVCLLRNIFWRLHNKIKLYPDGPMGLPFFGCLLQFGLNPRRFLVNIVNQYGPITYVPLMASNNIFISDTEILKTLYQKKGIIHRPEFKCMNKIPHFGSINGKQWIERRKYAMNTVVALSNTSFILTNIKKCMDQHINKIIDEKYIKNKQLWFPKQYVHYFAINIIFATTFGIILPFDDTFISQFSNASNNAVAAAGVSILFDLMVNCIDIWPDFLKWNISWKYMNYTDNLLIQWMNDNGFIVDIQRNILIRQNKTLSNDKMNVYIDLLIDKVAKNEMNIKQVFSDLLLIFTAGTDSTSKSAELGFLLLAKYPDIQEIVYNELNNIIKKYNLREFSFEILNELNIFQAFIFEVLRIGSATPTGIPHYTLNDHNINIDGKNIFIPKYTILHSNIYYIQKYMDWNTSKPLKKENNNIHLEYWLDSNGKFKMNDKFILFGIGKRDCVGKVVAQKTLFAIFGLMITKYKFVAANNDTSSMHIKQAWGLVLGVHPPIGVNIEARSVK